MTNKQGNIPEKAREFEANTVEEAIQEALKELRVSKDDINVRIVCEEKKGLFGMKGAKLAKIKVSLKEKEKKS